MSKPVPDPDPTRCQHHDALNRRCRMPRIDTHPAFCYQHAKSEREVRDADLRSNQFLTSHTTFHTCTDVNQALGRVFNLLSQGRISAREAIALGYLSQLLLQTLPGVKYEIEMTRGFREYEYMVREVVVSRPDPPSGASTAPVQVSQSGPAIPASVSTSQTGAATDPRVR